MEPCVKVEKVALPLTVSAVMEVVAKVDVPLAVKTVSVVEPVAESVPPIAVLPLIVTAPVTKVEPATDSVLPGVVVFIPILPEGITVNNAELVEVATVKILFAPVP